MNEAHENIDTIFSMGEPVQSWNYDIDDIGILKNFIKKCEFNFQDGITTIILTVLTSDKTLEFKDVVVMASVDELLVSYYDTLPQAIKKINYKVKLASVSRVLDGEVNELINDVITYTVI